MLKKLALAAFMMLLLPTLVCAATVNITFVSPDGTVQAQPYDPAPINLTVGSSMTFRAYPNSNYRFTSVAVTGGSNVSVTNANPFVVSAAANATNATVTVTFTAIPPVLTAYAGAAQTAMWSDATSSVTLDGTKSTPAGLTYAWAVTSPNAAAGHFTDLSPAVTGKKLFTADAAGVYSILLTVSKAGSNDSVSSTLVNFVSQAVYNSATCTNCHSLRDPLLVAAFKTSVHGLQTTTCENCHTATAIHPGNVSNATVDTNTYQVLAAGVKKPGGGVFAVGDNFCGNGNCHSGNHTATIGSDFLNGPHNGDLFTQYQGGNKCNECHGAGHALKKLLPNNNNAANTICLNCHYGTDVQFGVSFVQVDNWNNSNHKTTPYVAGGVGCTDCHNLHSTAGIFYRLSSSTSITDGKFYNGGTSTINGCQRCHNGSHGIAGSAPHYLGKAYISATPGAVNVGDSITQYVTQGAICGDCHGHNNTINAGFAEGGHGKVSSDPMNPFGHYDWSGRANDGTRLNSNCDRCHTAVGFIKLLGQDQAMQTRLALQAGKPNNVLICVGCHKSVEGELRGDAVVAGTVLTNGYFALFSSNKATIGANNAPTKIEIAFPGYKNSSICIPCHSGRTTIQYINQNIATIGNYSTLQNSNYQHAKNMGQTFIGKGAYDYFGNLATYGTAANQTPHSGIEMAAGQDQGPCVGCHYSTLSNATAANATHSLEVNYTSTTCTPCHGIAGPTEKASNPSFQGFSTARFALDTLIRAKFAPLYSGRGNADLNVERDGYFRYGRFGTANNAGPSTRTLAQKGYGAWNNWQILKTWDANAWAHNPAYARQILADTLTYLNNPAATASTDATVAAAIDAANAINALNKTAATGFIGGNKSSSALCTGCHAIARNAGVGYVQDNNGVRAITGEFGKWSHHVTGVTLQDAHCAACHMEGKAENGKIVVDAAYHMAGAVTSLRNVDTDQPIVWNPAQPNFSNMDNFCLSCHDSDGATSGQSAAIRAVMIPAEGKTASATNPFADTISNQYDMLERPAVVDAKGQFATGNNSHHAVLGKKYSGRTRVAGDRAIDTVAFANNSTAALPGKRSTIYDAGKFQGDYLTLADNGGESGSRNGGTTLGDDSTLHCGDCHTVGQFRAADTGTRYNTAVIGAHGSNNEYLLRNNIGSDARHQGAETTGNTSGVPTQGYGTKPYLVCFNCHAFATYGSVGAGTGLAGLNHAGEYANSTRCNGPENTIFGNMTGDARLRSMVTRTDSASYGKKDGTTTFGNMFGIQCANCHNSGTTAGNIFGGIHGSKDQTYTDGMGNTTKHFRFMPGLGNVMYVPGTKGGFTGGTLAAYNSYSGNRNGTGSGLTVGQTYSILPYRTIVPATTTANLAVSNGHDVGSVPSYATTTVKGVNPYTTGSYKYVTGGVSSDLNWEQKSAQPVAGEFDFQAKSMGCYTLKVAGNKKVNNLQANGYPADDIKYSATNSVDGTTPPTATSNFQAGLPGPNGTTTMFDNWGGCDDHDGAQGAGTAPFRKVLRPVSY